MFLGFQFVSLRNTGIYYFGPHILLAYGPFQRHILFTHPTFCIPFFFMPRHEFLLVHRDYLNIPRLLTYNGLCSNCEGVRSFPLQKNNFSAASAIPKIYISIRPMRLLFTIRPSLVEDWINPNYTIDWIRLRWLWNWQLDTQYFQSRLRHYFLLRISRNRCSICRYIEELVVLIFMDESGINTLISNKLRE